MKKVMMIVALVGLGVATYAEVGEVEVSGYLDMSITSTETETDTTSSAGLDRAEIRFKSELADGVAIEAHVAGGTSEDFDLEQAFVTYSAISNVTIIAGKYLSSLGWEAFHAPDLFQYSTSATLVYPGMHNGAGITYKTGDFEIYGAALSSAWDSLDQDPESGAFEGHVRYTGVENFTLFVGGATEKYTDYDQSLINIWASYAMGDLLLAAEFNGLDDWGAAGREGFGWLFMANYTITDNFGITLRTSALEIEDAAGVTDTEDQKYTIAPYYAVTDNLSFVAEFNTIEDLDGNTTDTYALESIITF